MNFHLNKNQKKMIKLLGLLKCQKYYFSRLGLMVVTSVAALFFGDGTPDEVKNALTKRYNPRFNSINRVKETILPFQQDNKSIEIEENNYSINKKSTIQSYINIVFTDTTGRWWAETKVDSNYFGQPRRLQKKLSCHCASHG